MQPQIKQIVAIENKICGLGEDNKVYRWDYGKASWAPNWNPSGDNVEETLAGTKDEAGTFEL